MKDHISELLSQALTQLIKQEQLPADLKANIQIDRCKDKAHGDHASNLAMTLAKQAGRNPRDIAQLIIDALPASERIKKVEIAGPGFINFFVAAQSAQAIIKTVLDQGQAYGRNNAGNNKKIQVEFVSANPTGPLHVGHGRGAAYGASVANLLKACGYEVQCEYYVNDNGRQMDILATSVWLRYLQLNGVELTFPSNGYQGEYIKDYAKQLQQKQTNQLCRTQTEVFANVSADASEGGDKETHIDDLIENAKSLLGHEDFEKVFSVGLEGILGDIRADLSEFGVEFDQWFSERSLALTTALAPSKIDHAIDVLRKNGHIEERDGALWFLSTRFGDDKDRVIKRQNGQTTYFASDIAYHLNKYERGFDEVINIWGADHHGYIARVKAALQAMDIDPQRLTVKLVQLVSLYRGQEKLQMSTRSGSFVTLRELREEVGTDASRFFYVMRKVEQATDFDLELAKSQTKDNPVYYIQYAHARVCSVLRKLADQGGQWDSNIGLNNLAKLTEAQEKNLMSRLSAYPDMVKNSALNHEPHSLIHFLRELAGEFHSYYNAHKVLTEDIELTSARLALSLAVKQVIANGLKLIGVSQPEKM